MADERFFGGRVRKQSLPVLEVPTGPDAPELKRLHLDQGELAQLCPSGVTMRYLAWIELKEGGLRGNHYHHRKEEWFYLIDGAVELVVENPDTKERETLALQAGDLVVIEVGIAHGLRPTRRGHGVEFSPAPFDPTDTISYPLE